MPIHDVVPPSMSRIAVTTTPRWNPPTPSCGPTMSPMKAIAMSPATRDTALLIAEPMPAWRSSIAPRMALVRGATVIVIPIPKRMTPGRICVQ